MHEELAIQTIQTGTLQVFSSMLGKELRCESPRPQGQEPGMQDCLIAQISLVGAYSITGLVDCSAEVASRIASAKLMEERTSVNAEVLDAMAEIANMIMGTVKTELDAQLGEVNLSIPTVTYGRNLSVHNNTKQWIVVPFCFEGQPLLVKVCFEPPFESRLSMAERSRKVSA